MACTPVGGDEWLHPAEKTEEMGEGLCTCGGCGTDGFGPDAGGKSREVDNEISTRGEP